MLLVKSEQKLGRELETDMLPSRNRSICIVGCINSEDV